MKKLYLQAFLFFAIFSFLSTRIFAEEFNWPEFLGPNGLGIAESNNVSAPITWSEEKNIAWKVEVPGCGWSSPVIWDNQIWLTTSIENETKRLAICYDLNSGQKLLETTVFEVAEKERCHSVNSFASSTSVIEDGRLYVHFGAIGTAAIDSATGEKIWERTDIQWEPIQGYGASPILFENLLILTCDGTDFQFLIALNKETGETVWKTERSADFEGIVPLFRKGYCSPLVVHYQGIDYLLSSSSKSAYAYDPRTGQERWRFDFPLDVSETSTMRPKVWNNRVVVNSGFGTKATLFALDFTQSGILTEEDIIWENDNNINQCLTPVLVNDHLFGADGRGIIYCISMETGETIWTKRIGGGHWASPVAQKERIYFFNDQNETVIIANNPEECQIIAKNQLDDGCMATPAFIGNAIILRTKTHLYRIENQEQ
ncbi:MAG: PQQ-binding-like beta-propeller repeat protein [Planctomycetia bacterium]|nr:PQQ-binding-like beta-propeller repeat protein [Planctomycetia bacterium]